MKWWTTKEIETAKLLYLVGGVGAVQKALPHRTRGSIQAKARIGKWPFWTGIAAGSIAEKALNLARLAPITARDLADEAGVKRGSASAILGQLNNRKVMTREAMKMFDERRGPCMVFVYTPNPEFLKAYDHDSQVSQPPAGR